MNLNKEDLLSSSYGETEIDESTLEGFKDELIEDEINSHLIDEIRNDTDRVSGKTINNSTFGKILSLRLNYNRDVKIITTAKSSSTGTGKTTFCIWICKCVDQNYPWKAEEKASIDLAEYEKNIKNAKKKSALLTDEIEHMADKRDAMTKRNKRLRQIWAKYRYMQLVHVGSLPSVTMLDSGILELADFWINVVRRGKAIPYYIWINDFEHTINRTELTQDGKTEYIQFPDLESRGDKDYFYVHNLKESLVDKGESQKLISHEDLQSQLEDKRKEHQKEVRDELLRLWYENCNCLTQKDIANIIQESGHDMLDIKQNTISTIINRKR